MSNSMEKRYQKYQKQYPEKEPRKALWDARAWIADKDHLLGYISRIDMHSKRYGFNITPADSMAGFMQEAICSLRVAYKEEEAVEYAFRMQIISLKIGSLLCIEQTDERIAEWLDWGDAAMYYSGGARPPLLTNSLSDNDSTELYRRVRVADEARPKCPECGCISVMSEMNNSGQILYCCDGWMCGSRFTSDEDN